MKEVRSAARRLAHAETKYDQRIIGALLLSVVFISFCKVTDLLATDAAHHAHVQAIELKQVISSE